MEVTFCWLRACCRLGWGRGGLLSLRYAWRLIGRREIVCDVWLWGVRGVSRGPCASFGLPWGFRVLGRLCARWVRSGRCLRCGETNGLSRCLFPEGGDGRVGEALMGCKRYRGWRWRNEK